jgi:hypothetical protein
VSTNRRRRVAAVALVGVVAILVVGYWFLFLGPGRAILSPPGSTVASFTGDANQITTSFTVRDGWAINWQSSGSSFAFAIKGDRDYGTVVNNAGPGSGITSPAGSGTFHLEVTAVGPWTIDITQGD